MLTGAQAPEDREGNFDNHPSLDFFLHGLLGAPVLLTASVAGAGTWKCMSFDAAGVGREPETNPADLFRQAFPADFVPPDPGDPAVDYANGENRIINVGQAQLAALEARLAGRREGQGRRPPGSDEGAAQRPRATCGRSAQCTTRGSRRADQSRQRRRLHPGPAGRPRPRRGDRPGFRLRPLAMCATLRILDDYPNFYTEVPEVQASGAGALYGADYRYHENLVHDYWGAEGSRARHLAQGLHRRPALGSHPLRRRARRVLTRCPTRSTPTAARMLDNTVIFWHSEFGHDGHDNQHMRHPVVIAGGGGRTLQARALPAPAQHRAATSACRTTSCWSASRTRWDAPRSTSSAIGT